MPDPACSVARPMLMVRCPVSAGVGQSQLLHRLANALGQGQGVACAGGWQQAGKLFAAIPGRQIGVTGCRLFEHLGDGAQVGIACGVAVIVVHGLEAIQVRHQHAQRRARAAAAGMLAQRLVESAAVG